MTIFEKNIGKIYLEVTKEGSKITLLVEQAKKTHEIVAYGSADLLSHLDALISPKEPLNQRIRLWLETLDL